MGFHGKRKSGAKGRKLLFGSRERSKALKGEAQERWILKEGFKGGKSEESR